MGLWLGQDINHTSEGAGDCHYCSIGCEYAHLLVIRSGLKDSVELAICGDSGKEHDLSESKTLVLKLPSMIACKVSREAVNSNFSYLCP